MNLEILTLCRDVKDDENGLSVIGINPLIDAIEMPCSLEFCLVCRIRFDLSEGGSHAVKIWITDVDGNKIANFLDTQYEFPIQEQWPVFTGTIIMRKISLLIPRFGIYSVELKVDADFSASQPLCFRDASQLPRIVE